jgi:hypothetical protein
MDTRAPKPTPEKLAAMKPGELYGNSIKPIWDKVSIYSGGAVFLKQLIEVGREQGLLLAAHWCMSEVCNGGFHQFFANSTGVLAPEAVRGFEMIGAKEYARISAEATSRFGTPYPRDREQRYEALDGLGYSAFNELDNQFYALGGRSFFAATADDYVRKNLDFFYK